MMITRRDEALDKGVWFILFFFSSYRMLYSADIIYHEDF